MMFATETVLALHRARMLDERGTRATVEQRKRGWRRQKLTTRPTPGFVLAR